MFTLTSAQRALAAADVVRRGFNLRLHPAGIVVNRYPRAETQAGTTPGRKPPS